MFDGFGDPLEAFLVSFRFFVFMTTRLQYGCQRHFCFVLWVGSRHGTRMRCPDVLKTYEIQCVSLDFQARKSCSSRCTRGCLRYNVGRFVVTLAHFCCVFKRTGKTSDVWRLPGAATILSIAEVGGKVVGLRTRKTDYCNGKPVTWDRNQQPKN